MSRNAELLASLTLSDWLGLAGIALSLLGFGVSIWQTLKAKNAAERARDAAQLAREGVRRLDSIIGFNAVAKLIEEIKEACRKDDFERIPALFDEARKALLIAKENHPNLNQEDIRNIQKSLVFFKTMELEITKSTRDLLAQQKIKYIKSLIDISDEIITLSNRVKSEETSS